MFMFHYLAILLLIMMSACQKVQSGADGAATSGPVKPKVMTERIVGKDLHDSLLYPARVDAGAQASVLAETDGLVASVKTTLGRAVAKGDILLTIENPDPVYRYAPVAVTAPVSGVVAFLDASVGNRVERGRKLLVVADIRAVKVSLEATAADLPSLKIGQSGIFHVGDRTIDVRISGISPVVDAATGTATVEVKPPRTEILYPGTLGRVEFRVRERKGIQVPDSSLVYRGTEPFLRIIDSGIARWLPVKIGSSAAGLTDIVDGVKPGDEFVTRSTLFIADGDAVDVEASKQGEVATK